MADNSTNDAFVYRDYATLTPEEAAIQHEHFMGEIRKDRERLALLRLKVETRAAELGIPCEEKLYG